MRMPKTVYCVAKEPNNIIETLLDIMDKEGPEPMRNMKPAQKQRTGAEQFQSDHQGEYEARGRQSGDKVNRVLMHNTAYPKMHDELDKKRSMGKPKAFTTKLRLTPSDSGSYCPRCSKLLKENRLAPKLSSHRRSHKYKTSARVSKPKRSVRQRQRTSSRLFKFSRIRTNKCCQCTSYPKPVQKRSASTCNDYDSMQSIHERNCNTVDNNDRKYTIQEIHPPRPIKTASPNNGERKSDDSRSEQTPEPSVSSYNSYASLDHEPMVE
ncbi:uncharacterized protein LOC142985277 [Anticarsia gemmatalis]|uniref:uncharacterized protein LOC142985277 n=1 Tax=Anticarsia gemmatalis TaxID=129554 RepID=UPI003F76C11F